METKKLTRPKGHLIMEAIQDQISHNEYLLHSIPTYIGKRSTRLYYKTEDCLYQILEHIRTTCSISKEHKEQVIRCLNSSQLRLADLQFESEYMRLSAGIRKKIQSKILAFQKLQDEIANLFD